MVATEELRNAWPLRKLVRTADIDAIINVPGGATVKVSYVPPVGYVWFKVDVRHNSMPGRTFQLRIIADGDVELYDTLIPTGWISESWRCVIGSVVSQKLEFTITNTDSVAHDFDALVRGFIVPFQQVQTVTDSITSMALSQQTQADLAVKIAAELSKSFDSLADKIANKLAARLGR